MGIHDSNANFLPYLAKGYANCILNSTGTWCVAMQSGSARRLTDEEIRAQDLLQSRCLQPAGEDLGVSGRHGVRGFQRVHKSEG